MEQEGRPRHSGGVLPVLQRKSFVLTSFFSVPLPLLLFPLAGMLTTNFWKDTERLGFHGGMPVLQLLPGTRPGRTPVRPVCGLRGL